jgi:hypothetical protein
MELFDGKINLHRDGVEWGRYEYDDGITSCHDYSYYFWWWNPLSKEYRYWGRQDMWYDGPHRTLGFWFFNFSWVFPGDTGKDLI